MKRFRLRRDRLTLICTAVDCGWKMTLYPDGRTGKGQPCIYSTRECVIAKLIALLSVVVAALTILFIEMGAFIGVFEQRSQFLLIVRRRGFWLRFDRLRLRFVRRSLVCATSISTNKQRMHSWMLGCNKHREPIVDRRSSTTHCIYGDFMQCSLCAFEKRDQILLVVRQPVRCSLVSATSTSIKKKFVLHYWP